jgi:hypothetical protein
VDPYYVTIWSACAEATLSVPDASRTSAKSAYVTATSSFLVNSIAASIVKTPATCTDLTYLVEVYDDSAGIWTSLTTNAVYSNLLTDGFSAVPNNSPSI